MNLYRTHNCGELNIDHINNDVYISGWINKKRDHGGLLFVDLRDEYGITQCVINSENPKFKLVENIDYRDDMFSEYGFLKILIKSKTNKSMVFRDVLMSLQERIRDVIGLSFRLAQQVDNIQKEFYTTERLLKLFQDHDDAAKKLEQKLL